MTSLWCFWSDLESLSKRNIDCNFSEVSSYFKTRRSNRWFEKELRVLKLDGVENQIQWSLYNDILIY